MCVWVYPRLAHAQRFELTSNIHLTWYKGNGGGSVSTTAIAGNGYMISSEFRVLLIT